MLNAHGAADQVLVCVQLLQIFNAHVEAYGCMFSESKSGSPGGSGSGSSDEEEAEEASAHEAKRLKE